MRSFTVMLGVLGLTIGVGVMVSIVRELSLEMTCNPRVTESKGLIVTNGDKCSSANEAGMRRGDVLGEVYQQKVEKVRDYRAALGRVGSADSLLVLVISPGGNVMYVALKMAKRGGSLSLRERVRVRGVFGLCRLHLSRLFSVREGSLFGERFILQDEPYHTCRR